MSSNRTVNIMKNQAVTGDGDVVQAWGARKWTCEASVAGTGAVTAQVLIYGSNTGNFWVLLATMNLSGTTSDSGGFTSAAPWDQIKANLAAVSGTGAAVNVTLGMPR